MKTHGMVYGVVIDKKATKKCLRRTNINKQKKYKCLATSCCFIKNQQYAKYKLINQLSFSVQPNIRERMWTF